MKLEESDMSFEITQMQVINLLINGNISTGC